MNLKDLIADVNVNDIVGVGERMAESRPFRPPPRQPGAAGAGVAGV